MDALEEFRVELLEDGCRITSDNEVDGVEFTSEDPAEIAGIRWLASALINRTRQRDEALDAREALELDVLCRTQERDDARKDNAVLAADLQNVIAERDEARNIAKLAFNELDEVTKYLTFKDQWPHPTLEWLAVEEEE